LVRRGGTGHGKSLGETESLQGQVTGLREGGTMKKSLSTNKSGSPAFNFSKTGDKEKKNGKDGYRSSTNAEMEGGGGETQNKLALNVTVVRLEADGQSTQSWFSNLQEAIQ